MLGAEEEATPEADEENFFYQKWYDSEYARFIDPPDDTLPKEYQGMSCPDFCPSCSRQEEQEKVSLLQQKAVEHTPMCKRCPGFMGDL